MPVGTYLCLHAVGVGNPLAVPCSGRYGAKQGTGSCDPRDPHVSGSHVRRVLENHNIRTPPLRSPTWPVRCVFFATEYSSDTVLFGEVRLVFVKYFVARKVRTDQRWDAGVGTGGGQPGSSAREGRSLHVDRHVDVELIQRGAPRHHQLGGLSRWEKRGCLAAGLSSG
jgi:hypothetical protein